MRLQKQETSEADLFKSGFRHSCFIKLVHHSSQEDFAESGTTFHHLQKTNIMQQGKYLGLNDNFILPNK